MARHLLGGLSIGAGFFLVVFVVMRLTVTYRLQSDMVRLQATLDAHEVSSEQIRKDAVARIRRLEQTVFGELEPLTQSVAKRPPQPLSRLEQWMMNSNKDLRERIDRLERQIRELR